MFILNINGVFLGINLELAHPIRLQVACAVADP